MAAGFLACQTTEQTARQAGAEAGLADSAASTQKTVAQLDLEKYRNTLDDVYVTQQHDFPEIFTKTYQGDAPKARDPFDGFRIQILSTRNVALADSAAKNFRIWADTTLSGYTPQTYVFFKQPHYKVHVGDFHDRERANRFSRLVKRKYPDAWVVHDRINPYLVPADTAQFNIIR